MKRILLLLSAMALLTGGCATKPVVTTSTATPAPAASPAAAKATKKIPSANPVPADWITMADEVRGYEFKDKTRTKDDLMKNVESALQSMGEKDIKVTDIKEISDDYSVANISSVDEKGKTTKGKVLVGTDVTDNYIVMVGTEADKYAANEKTIDEIWGSFTMYSGGASGTN
jgi:hypothetical protein